ncbi:hypothetical protein PSTG_08262 [Puccinia striiformis f. sp. tritici PST-78]|uniref:DUF659 domain-containing protein n=1 Tax=Puccinia striiformis f. sp. tritici PST-78 TaxID=1165861 RepID=A0A0L0VGW4_9BASI|nr:hypothetical protein PSTG_08262 [Puccinia striiformis f. sp. tritici PST-78]
MRRRKAPASPPPESLESDIATQSKQRTHQKKRLTTSMVLDDSDDETPATNAAMLQSQELSDEQELAKARRVHQNQPYKQCGTQIHCPTYNTKDGTWYLLPVCVHLKNSSRFLGPDGRCLELVGGTLDLLVGTWHLTRGSRYLSTANRCQVPSLYDTSPSNLSKHVAACSKKQQDAKEIQKLAAVGVTGTPDVDPREVPQLCAIWAVATNIAHLYTAVQQSIRRKLQKHTGAMYLGLDAWQSPNGYNILGTVIYCLIEDDGGGFKLDVMPLDFIWLKQSHTGAYLADTVRLIVEKFGVQNKICGIVTDNASNNATMTKEIKKFKWPRFKGKAHWI